MSSKSNITVFSLMLLLLLLVIALELGCGSYWVNPLELLNGSHQTLLKLRLLRAATAFVIGGALAVSGLAYQAVLRNPLAEPYILGISGGAGIGAAIAIVSGMNALTVMAIPASAFVCALLALAAVLLFARGAGMEYTTNIMLSGIIIGSLCSSMLMFIISTIGMDSLNSVTWWLLGNLQGADPKLLLFTAAVTGGGTAVLFIFGREANAISLSEEMAHNFGVSPQKIILLLLLTASLMAAAAVSLAGIIGFVGLIVPHILRRLFGAEHRRLFPLTLLGGGIFLMLCDICSRIIYPAQEIQVGVVTAFIGGPFFLWALNHKRRGGA